MGKTEKNTMKSDDFGDSWANIIRFCPHGNCSWAHDEPWDLGIPKIFRIWTTDDFFSPEINEIMAMKSFNEHFEDFQIFFYMRFSSGWWFLTILKTMSSSMGRMTSHISWKTKKMFETTNQIYSPIINHYQP